MFCFVCAVWPLPSPREKNTDALEGKALGASEGASVVVFCVLLFVVFVLSGLGAHQGKINTDTLEG